MNILHAVILGIVEGLTEFLPISSTAHLEIASTLLGIAQTPFIKSFEIAIQLGAMLAVISIYAKIMIERRGLWRPVVAAFIPTALVGFVLYKIIKNYLLGNVWLIVFTLAIGGAIIIWFDRKTKKLGVSNSHVESSTNEIIQMKSSTAIWIGLAQALAVIPGVSRSAATIVAGQLLGLSRVAIVEFSFLLAVPTLAAATGYDLLKNASTFSVHEFGLLAVGFIVAFISAYFAIRSLLRYIRNHSFASFGIYRIIMAILFALFLWWA